MGPGSGIGTGRSACRPRRARRGLARVRGHARQDADSSGFSAANRIEKDRARRFTGTVPAPSSRRRAPARLSLTPSKMPCYTTEKVIAAKRSAMRWGRRTAGIAAPARSRGAQGQDPPAVWHAAGWAMTQWRSRGGRRKRVVAVPGYGGALLPAVRGEQRDDQRGDQLADVAKRFPSSPARQPVRVGRPLNLRHRDPMRIRLEPVSRASAAMRGRDVGCTA